MVDVRYDLAFRLYPYEKSADQEAPARRHPVVIAGGGPVGMAAALDLGKKGVPVLVLDDHEGVGQGSRAICFSKRTLEIADRLGAGEAMVRKGVVWNKGKVFHGDNRVFEFNLQPQAGHRRPAFINLQQPYFEKYLVDEIRSAQNAGAPIEIRGRNAVTGIEVTGDIACLQVETPDGIYALEADWVIACDGARSPLRQMMGLSFEGRVFEDNFLIADVKMKADFPTERWFWFEPPFKNSGQSALLHKQPDDIWRIDFQLGWDIDREKELDPARIRERVDAMLGDEVAYDLEWTSIYTFQCRRMERFRHGPVLFAGDAAHQVSPFGARGANSGIQDVDNLCWKLDMVIRGAAPAALLDTYSEERVVAADENILNSTRATDFLTPKSGTSAVFRNAVLELAGRYPFARPLVNSGRLSVPCVYDGSSLNGPDISGAPQVSRPGAACPDAQLATGYILDRLTGDFSLLCINNTDAASSDAQMSLHIVHLDTSADDPAGALTERYLGDLAAAVYLIRPDQHVAARWDHYDPVAVQDAIRAATGGGDHD
ncbi:FAD-dependent oxidoreductase [uncultured Roseobacter sp.]|uniref:FAD-dependent oxidoreductase n=1 Tax=uncultured Roseobacter sp. TaxID=114847 RepID=UPI00263801E6|nr:FAD-dependent oxidoreductase [uncultured Roseobacter sp.]